MTVSTYARLTMRRILHARRERLIYLLRAWQWSLRRAQRLAPSTRTYNNLALSIASLEALEMAAYDSDAATLVALSALGWTTACGASVSLLAVEVSQ